MIVTHIGRSVSITGEVSSSEDLRIDGHVNGLVLVRDAALTIGPDARIEADIRGARVQVQGDVRGAISASQRIELTQTASVHGSLSANHVVLIEGSRFNGRIDMDRRTIAAKLAQYKAQSA